MIMKNIYDKYYKSLILQSSDKIFLNFYKKYFLLFIKFSKLIIQRVKLFKIVKKKDNLIYKLKLLNN